MPSKTAKGKTHNRASSASSTNKLALNSAFTRNKSNDKIKRNTSDIQHLVTRNASPYPHLPQARTQAQHQASPTKRPVMLAVETNTGDDDEWVSSESGAVTPADHDDEDTPPSPDTPDAAQGEEPESVPSTTPRGEAPPIPPPRARPKSLTDFPRVDTITPLTQLTQAAPIQTSDAPSLIAPILQPQPPRTRPPSTRSTHSARPHPLIRARTYGPTTPIITAPPALAPVHTSASASPSPISSPRKSGLTQSPSSGSDYNYTHHLPHRVKRQNSQSSLASVTTLPLPTSSTAIPSTSMSRVHGERQRTLSHASTSAALSSLTAAAHPHAPSRPASPVMPIAFPPVDPRSGGEYVHGMIPPPLVPPHLSAMAHQSPMLEAIQRVARMRAR